MSSFFNWNWNNWNNRNNCNASAFFTFSLFYLFTFLPFFYQALQRLAKFVVHLEGIVVNTHPYRHRLEVRVQRAVSPARNRDVLTVKDMRVAPSHPKSVFLYIVIVLSGIPSVSHKGPSAQLGK